MSRHSEKIVVHYFILFVIVLLAGCSSDKLDFAPKTDPAATYAFSITPQQKSKITYNLTEITQQASKDDGSGSQENYTFLLKGIDKNLQASVVISGRAGGSSHSNLNIAITQNGSTTFYKDCNNLILPVEKGENDSGKFIRFAGNAATCITTTLDSERAMNIEASSLSFNQLTFYTPED